MTTSPKPKAKSKAGRKPFDLPPMEEIEQMAATGLTDLQIRHAIGMGNNTFYKKKESWLSSLKRFNEDAQRV